MKKLLVFICCMLFSASALADKTLGQWLDRVAVRGAQIEIIRVENNKALVEIEETDAQVDDILEEVEALEEASSDSESETDAS